MHAVERLVIRNKIQLTFETVLKETLKTGQESPPNVINEATCLMEKVWGEWETSKFNTKLGELLK